MTSGWENAWRGLVPLPDGAPSWVFAAIGLFAIFFLVVLPAAMTVTYVERKLGADLQARVGPNRAGPAGILQPLADLIKLLEKGLPTAGRLHRIPWVWIQTAALFSTLAALPLGSTLVLLDTDLSALVPFWAALVASLATLLAGLRLNAGTALPGWVGGFRVAAQAMAGAFPALVSLLCAAASAGSFRWTEIAASQGFSPIFWSASNPFLLIAFVVFMISGLVLFALPPLDSGFSPVELHGGVASAYQGWWLILLRLSRFYGFFLWSVMAVVLFLGGWTLPGSLSFSLREAEAWLPLSVLEFGWLFLKTIFLMVVVQWIARTNPRSRVDQVTDFSWRVLGPFALLALIGTTIWTGRGAWM